MNTRELRINNYIQYKKGHLVYVKALNNRGENGEAYVNGLGDNYINGYYRLSDMKPIPLTEEWLVKFGFEKIKNNGIDYELHDCVISFEAEWMWTSESKLNEVRTLIPKHVHQLQNLYFALTNEELTLK
jgi:hypothetical protein